MGAAWVEDQANRWECVKFTEVMRIQSSIGEGRIIAYWSVLGLVIGEVDSGFRQDIQFWRAEGVEMAQESSDAKLECHNISNFKCTEYL